MHKINTFIYQSFDDATILVMQLICKKINKLNTFIQLEEFRNKTQINPKNPSKLVFVAA